ncbi:nucleotide disphospho-sugar-binding domain-containing protein [Variovorax sp. PCZ-1]|uniref:glycosyltransferase n=1 Tax=Variovorax sp. PCZ-1 TaxID=2835533 RepID=UPI001BCC23A6|nr:nucleotide disphospho-sugar-binding domain-containing protein [Variovorax sp. PCZ-1]MBS7807659.1 glycosyltransferase [Variovorax sp. PCZ-1]
MKQRFLIASVGSLGDALPYLHLAQQLQGIGHEVRLFCNEEHRARIERAGIEFVSAGLDLAYESTLQNPNLWHPVKGMGVLWRGLLAPCIVPLYQTIRDLPGGCKNWHVIAGPQMLGARLAQEHLGARLISVYTAPNMLRTCIAPTTVAHTYWPKYTPRWLVSAMWAAVDRYKLDPMARSTLTRICTELAIKPPPQHISLFGQWVHSTERGITLYPAWFSPVPKDQPDHIVSGDFPLPAHSNASGVLSYELQAFLQSGRPPIVVMLGSAMQHAAHLYARWLEAALSAGQRAILISADASQLPSTKHTDVLTIAFAPFETLLPQASVLIHHGGIGSCIQALSAGIPQIVQPHSHDQFENARCAQALGAALRLGRDASAQQMHHILLAALRPECQTAAKAAQAKMPANGLARLGHLIAS